MTVQDVDVLGENDKQQKREQEASAEMNKDTSKAMNILMIFARIFGVLFCLYFFLVGIELMGSAFKVLGGNGAGNTLRDIPNSLAALMVGVLATVMVQSSSTSTSIVVALVSAGQLQVRPAVPIIMGANIGTTVTNTIVSMGHAGDRLELERAFAGATVHDMFNLMSVGLLFPIEELFHPIEAIASALAEAMLGDETCDGCDFDSPVKEAVGPMVDLFIESNKNVIYSLSLGEPTAESGTVTVTENCDDSDSTKAKCGAQKYWCMDKEMNKTWAKIHTHKYPVFSKSRWPCEDHGFDSEDLCGSCTAAGCGPVCALSADVFYKEEVKHGDTIKAGIFDFDNSEIGGTCALILSLFIMMGGLMGFVKVMHKLLLSKAKEILRASTMVPGYLAILIGTGITIVVQSSSVTTSALTPLVGLGILPLSNMFPLTLGANIGTCSTSVLAALASMKANAMTIALCHLTFNVVGIVIFYPLPQMRRIPIYLASLAGMYASVYRWFPAAYIVFVYVALPLVALGVGFLFEASTAGGVVVLILLILAALGFAYWWAMMGGCYRFLSKEQRLTTIFGRTLEGEPSEPEATTEAAQAAAEEGDVRV
mmetsp:Transcript_68766/g.143612  ORF Transcript_68766/g.143612 Transcript_68766/m.143612 type:complete len:595 (+) Transcript_68766:81-1865(+)